MKVLIVTQHYYPETVATSRRPIEVGDDLAAAGHEVTILAGMPNHPSTFMSGNLELNPPRRERKSNGVRVIRVPVFSSANRAWMQRTFTYGTFGMMSALRGLTLPKYDCIIGISPLPTVMSAMIVAMKQRTPLIFDLLDIWPEGALIAGGLKEGKLYDFLQFLEYETYRRSSFIFAVSKGFEKQLVDNGVDPSKVVFVPNGVDVDFIHEAEPDMELLREFNLADKFPVVFIGNHGIMQGLDVALDAAKLLLDRKDIRFVFVGEGVGKPDLVRRVREEGISNCIFIPGQLRNRVPGLLALGKINLVTLLPTDRFNKWIPSKIYESMASERPIVTNVPGETSDMVREADCGIAATPGSAEGLRDGVLRLYNDESLRRRCGSNGLQWVRANATREVVRERFLESMEKAVSRRWHWGIF